MLLMIDGECQFDESYDKKKILVLVDLHISVPDNKNLCIDIISFHIRKIDFKTGN